MPPPLRKLVGIGDDIESVVSKLLVAVDNDVRRWEGHYIYRWWDRQMAKKEYTHPDVSGESAGSRECWSFEGRKWELWAQAARTPWFLWQRSIPGISLFICGGAFPDLGGNHRAEATKQTAIGFNGELAITRQRIRYLSKVIRRIRVISVWYRSSGKAAHHLYLQGADRWNAGERSRSGSRNILKQYQKPSPLKWICSLMTRLWRHADKVKRIRELERCAIIEDLCWILWRNSAMITRQGNDYEAIEAEGDRRPAIRVDKRSRGYAITDKASGRME